MGKRSGVPEAEEAAAKLSRDELDHHIDWISRRFGSASNSQMRKLYFRQLVWLESQREKLHGIAAPKRTLRSRQA